MAIGIEKQYTEEMKEDIDFNTCTLGEVLEEVELLKDQGIFTYLDAGGEQTIFEIFNPTQPRLIAGIWLDMVNITENGNIKIYYKIDGLNYRLADTFAFTVATDADGTLITIQFPISDDFKVTYTEDADESADREIPYQIFYQHLD